VDTCHSDELKATAVPKCSRSTRFGNRAWLAGMAKARATPNSVMMPNTGSALCRPRQENASNSSAQSNSRT
jgi:hypothetical protein